MTSNEKYLPPLKPGEENDPLLQPLEPVLAETYDTNTWELITDSGENFGSTSLYNVVKWVVRPDRRPFRMATLLRHRIGDPK